jgi:hypothetical protein
LERSYSGLIDVLPAIYLEELRKTMKNLSISVEIQTEHIPKTSIQHYSHANSLNASRVNLHPLDEFPKLDSISL